MTDFISKRFTSGGFSVSGNETLQIAEYPDGTDIRREIYTNKPITMNASFIFTKQELIAFQSFFSIQLRYGLKDFYFVYPLNDRKTRMQFASPMPAVTVYNNTHFQVSMKIKVFLNDTID